MKKDSILVNPTKPIVIRPDMSCDELHAGLEGCSFQGRQLARAARIWTEALDEDIVVFFGLAGAMVPAGMRKVIVTLMEHRLIDVIVSTGANLYHDYYETVGYHHFLGSPAADDTKLRDARIDRIYDTYADEDVFMDLDRSIGGWAKRTLEERPYTTREFLELLGREAAKHTKGEAGILSTAADLGVPVYCPAIGDSSIGIGLAEGNFRMIFDVIGDVEETADLAATKETMVIYVGGGTPKNFIQQTEVTNIVLNRNVLGHRYAIQFVVDAPHWGGLSGCTFDEAKSWDKMVDDFQGAQVFLEASVGFPLLAKAVLERFGEKASNRSRPSLDIFQGVGKS